MAKRYLVFILLVFALFSAAALTAQDVINKRISGAYENMTILEVFSAIEASYQVKFMYDPSYIPYFRINYSCQDETIYDALFGILKSTGMMGVAYDDNTIIVTRKINLSKDRISNIYEKWTSGEYQAPTSEESAKISAVFGDSGKSNTLVNLSGKVVETYSDTELIGATILNRNTGNGAATDEEGNYTITLPSGKHVLEISYFGYQNIEYSVEIYEDATHDFSMNVSPLTIEEVVITAKANDQALKEVSIGVTTIDKSEIRELPTFLGEADIIKTLHSLPGVSTVGEGATGFNVRGGNIDQNLVTLDGSRLYNTSHALGFFSVFNVDVVDNIKLYKGHIPARYGGRVASYLDVDLKTGDFEKVKGYGGIGLMSSKFTIEGPLVKNKLSIIAGVRASYTDWIALIVDVPNVKNSSINFADASLKLSQKIKNGSIDISGYHSNDQFLFAKDFGYSWNTSTLNADYKQLVDDKWSLKLNANFGDYKSEQLDLDPFNGFNYGTGMRDYGGSLDMTFVPAEDNIFVVGAQSIFYDTPPESINPTSSNSSIEPQSLNKDQASLLSYYVDGEFVVTPRLSISAGLRYNLFTALGPGEVFSYDQDAPRIKDNVTGVENYESGDKIISYNDLEPRISVNFKITPQKSIKASFNRISQYVHLFSNTAAATPVDVWQLSNAHFKPQQSNNLSLGYFFNLNNNNWENAIEVYYKEVDNIPVFKNIPDIVLNNQIETEVVNGQSRAMGIELSTKKKIGYWTGQLSYTYSISELRTNSPFDQENINNRNWFRANYDQPHQISINARYQKRPRSFFVFGFTFNSGRPITLPSGGYFLDNLQVTDYSDRNADRIPAYHRLDIGYTITNEKARIKGVKSNVTISLYNLYNRKNPFSIFSKRDNRNIPRTFRFAVIGTVFPSISYNFNF